MINLRLTTLKNCLNTHRFISPPPASTAYNKTQHFFLFIAKYDRNCIVISNCKCLEFKKVFPDDLLFVSHSLNLTLLQRNMQVICTDIIVRQNILKCKMCNALYLQICLFIKNTKLKYISVNCH